MNRRDASKIVQTKLISQLCIFQQCGARRHKESSIFSEERVTKPTENLCVSLQSRFSLTLSMRLSVCYCLFVDTMVLCVIDEAPPPVLPSCRSFTYLSSPTVSMHRVASAANADISSKLQTSGSDAPPKLCLPLLVLLLPRL